MSSTFKHIGTYICECGREFDNSQSFGGHKSHCKVHQLAVHGSLDVLENTKQKQVESLKKHYDELKPTLLKEKELKQAEETKKWVEEKHICEKCGKVMTEKFGSGRFCSSECAHSRVHSDETRSKVSNTLKLPHIKEYNEHPAYCCVCGKPLEYAIRGRKTCSDECYKMWFKSSSNGFTHELAIKGGIRSAQSQQRRSKNEIYFCELCENYFKEVKHNESIFNGWDADVIIEDIKYAVLWNGPWHYKQIGKNQSLLQVQTRDKIKVDQITLCGYTPYIIKDMGGYDPKFVDEQFKLFIDSLNTPIV